MAEGEVFMHIPEALDVLLLVARDCDYPYIIAPLPRHIGVSLMVLCCYISFVTIVSIKCT